MTATREDIEMIAGDTPILAFGPVIDEDGNYADLLGASAKWWMGRSERASGANVWVRKNTSDGGIVIVSETLPNGKIRYTVEVALDPEDTLDVTPCASRYQHWYHELEITDVAGGIF